MSETQAGSDSVGRGESSKKGTMLSTSKSSDATPQAQLVRAYFPSAPILSSPRPTYITPYSVSEYSDGSDTDKYLDRFHGCGLKPHTEIFLTTPTPQNNEEWTRLHENMSSVLPPGRKRWWDMVDRLERAAKLEAEGREYSGDTDSDSDNETTLSAMLENTKREEGDKNLDSQVDSASNEDEPEMTEEDRLYQERLWKAKFPDTLLALSFDSDNESDSDYSTESEDSDMSEDSDAQESDKVGASLGHALQVISWCFNALAVLLFDFFYTTKRGLNALAGLLFNFF